MKILVIIIAFIFIFSPTVIAEHKIEILELGDHKLILTHWIDSSRPLSRSERTQKDTVILLSGPTDNWNSDSAWFARLAPKLARKFQVFSIDRPGLVLAEPNAKLGYLEFGKAIHKLINQLELKNIHFVSFASSNLALMQYFQLEQIAHTSKILLIDPDVLLPYSINRYANDAEPFNKNLTRYVNYIKSGKYDKRALQKNQIDLEHLKSLSQLDQDTDWDYVNYLFDKRLEHSNLINLFSEISIYHSELKKASKLLFPTDIPLTIIDTDFEQAYLDKTDSEEEKEGLNKWRNEARQYYQSLTNSVKKGRYIELTTKEHLIPFANPQIILDSLSDSSL